MQSSLWRRALDVGWGPGKEGQDELLGAVPRYECCQRLAPQVGMLGTTNLGVKGKLSWAPAGCAGSAGI